MLIQHEARRVRKAPEVGRPKPAMRDDDASFGHPTNGHLDMVHASPGITPGLPLRGGSVSKPELS